MSKFIFFRLQVCNCSAVEKRQERVTRAYDVLEASSWANQTEDQIFPEDQLHDQPNLLKFRGDTHEGERNHPCKFEVDRNTLSNLDISPYRGCVEPWATALNGEDRGDAGVLYFIHINNYASPGPGLSIEYN
jgi:hypothetical protein